MVETLTVNLAERSYPIVVGERLLARAGEYIAPLLSQPRVIVVTDDQVARLYLHRLSGALEEKGIAARPIVLPAGEQSKSFATFESLVETILEQRPDRGTMLVALGGGVIGDLTGFAASVTLRGLDFIQIPTTLLSQVDSSVGGKTAINSSFGKNLVGSFHQPRLVLADVGVLSTLPRRELLSGYAEVVKYGFINRPDFFAWLEENGARLLAGDSQALIHAVLESCRTKAAIVGADERESGERALLNLGHTFGHALEAETGYSQTLLHGEAVAMGMVMAFALSVKLGHCPKADLERAVAHYRTTGLPYSPLEVRSSWDADALMEHFTRDKKARNGRMTFILSRGIGKAFIDTSVTAEQVRPIVEQCCGLA